MPGKALIDRMRERSLERVWRIAVDTGGTFTDCCATRPDGTPARFKLLSSGCLRASIELCRDGRQATVIECPWDLPDRFFQGFEAEIPGLATARRVREWRSSSRTLTFDQPFGPHAPRETVVELRTGEEAPVVGARLLTRTPLGSPFPPVDFRLATTRGTNALLEGRGTPPLLLVTRGFRDLLRIGDQRRTDLFGLTHHVLDPLHGMVVEVDERVDADGNIIAPLVEEAISSAAGHALRAGYRTAAVALVHSFRNPSHEHRIRQILEAHGFSHVSLSSTLAPMIKVLPRGRTAVVDAYLAPIMQAFLSSVARDMGMPKRFQVMTSAGGLEPAAEFRPKDSLLSGPAGGIVGASRAGKRAGFDRLLTFDMGGTSTDVARFDGEFDYTFVQAVGHARLLAPALRIETVAAGGGSICRLTPAGLAVGPESAGAAPGPACYGRGGPLTLTDVNLLLGRFDPAAAPIPINVDHARARLRELQDALRAAGAPPEDDEDLLRGLLRIAVERMAAAIRRISVEAGYDPRDFTLLAFGGAGPQHACDVADSLGIGRILVPEAAGILSAEGLLAATPERFAQQQILAPLERVAARLDAILEALRHSAARALEDDGVPSGSISVRRRIAELRMAGQESPLQIEITSSEALESRFRSAFADLFGFAPPVDRPIEVVSLSVFVSREAPSLAREEFGAIEGPVEQVRLLQSSTSTTVVTPGWGVQHSPSGTLLLTRAAAGDAFVPQALDAPVPPSRSDSPIATELFRSRFQAIVDEMGARLKRTAVSTNVKEREDYSCAILDARGRLVINAPHIPVHLGALGLCVREVAAAVAMKDGDVVVTNHPAFGGSHLPDVTVIAPVFDAKGVLLGYVANRAHHAEIGGIVPGSMPPAATSLEEEGVVIAPFKLFDAGSARYGELETEMRAARHPSRNIADNLLDLRAQAASVLSGRRRLQRLAAEHGTAQIDHQLGRLESLADEAIARRLGQVATFDRTVEEFLDDGTVIRIRMTADRASLTIDFAGTSPRHPGSLNATPAIVRSAVLYVVRLWVREDLPLNEGLLNRVRIVLSPCFLNPDFHPADPARCPAVVGGNVETSQRVVDGLVRALDLQAGSQGTMNNVIFGNSHFGYYETLGGGAGAGPDHAGASGLHTHMTNTAITDVEVIEARYPVRIETFGIRRGSGGAGRQPGGDGLVREYRFAEAARVSLLTEHRTSGPRGAHGGNDGSPGAQFHRRLDGSLEPLPHRCTVDVAPGEGIRVETPGGGGWGPPEIPALTG